MKVFKKIIYSIFIVIFLLLLFIKIKHGRGSLYPDLSQNPIFPETALERIVALDYPPGNIAISGNGRIFFNYHPFVKAERFGATVFELVNGKPEPFPSMEYQKKYQGVFGMTIDSQNRIWFVEPASLDFPKTNLIAFDINTKEKIFDFSFPENVGRFAQDLRITSDGKKVILADTGFFKFTDPGLIVFNTDDKSYKVFLQKHPAAQPQDWVMQTPYGLHRLGYGLITFTVGLDGIEINEKNDTIYLGPMSNDSIYKASLSALIEPNATEESVSKTIQKVGQKTLSDGITIDDIGNVIITDTEHGAIVKLNPNSGKLETIVKSSKVIWSDGVVFESKTGSIYFTDSAIPAYVHQLALPPAEEKFKQKRPFGIYRIKIK